MPMRQVTIETRLNNNCSLVLYAKDYISYYCSVFRQIWQEMTDSNYSIKFPKESDFTRYCRDKYNMLGRTLNSIITDVKGRKKSYVELKRYELSQIEFKIEKQQEIIDNIIKTLNELKPSVTQNKATKVELSKYITAKRNLYHAKNKLNKMNNKKNKLEYIISNNVYSICFGTKDLFSKYQRLDQNGYKTHTKWRNNFIKNRDKNIFYLGSCNESYGNQMFQLIYNKTTDDFTAVVRKENKYSEKEKYVFANGINFKHRKNELVEILEDHKSKIGSKPVSYRIIRRRNKWYLQAVYSIFYDETEYTTVAYYGTIGLDFNNGFIQLAETDDKGNLIKLQKYELHKHDKGNSNKLKTELQQTIYNIVKYASKQGKDLSIENLNFKRTKAKQIKAKSKKGKNYNKMTHGLEYSKYIQIVTDDCVDFKVRLHKVNPKNTSKIGKQKYGNGKRNMNPHQAASFVIARKAQGYIDKLVKE